MPNISSATTIQSVQLTEQSTAAPQPSSGYFRIYASSGSILRGVDDSGNDYPFATGSVGPDVSTQSFIVVSTTSAVPNARALRGTALQVIVTDAGAGGYATLSTPQDIGTGSTVQFAQVNASTTSASLTSATTGSFSTVQATTSSASLHTGTTGSFGVVQATTATIATAATVGTRASVGTTSLDSSASLHIVGQYYSRMYDDGTVSSASVAFDWSSGNEHKAVLSTASTISFSNAVVGGRYVVLLKQDSTGSRVVTWPVAVLWPNGGGAPTLSTTGSKTDLFTFFYDGTNYFGNYSLTH
jgi:hypothetical protein